MHNIGFFINMNYINKREYCVVWKITRDAHNNHINVSQLNPEKARSRIFAPEEMHNFKVCRQRIGKI